MGKRRNPEGGLGVALAAGLGLLLFGGKKAAAAPAQQPPTPSGGAPVPKLQRYKPGSPEQIALFEEAAKRANLPVEWASSSGVKMILTKESIGGWVGIPNYTWAKFLGVPVQTMWNTPSLWPKVWEVIRADKGNSYTGISSHATGLGQLQPSNMKAYQPSGIKGVGDPLEEAIGLLRYIADRYGSPAVVEQIYGKTGTYVHAITGKTMTKSFKEGY